MSLVLNFDSDGVIFPFHTQMEPYIVDAGYEPDMSSWNMGLERSVFRSLFAEAIRAGVFSGGNPIEGSVEAITQVQAAGHRVRIVTSKIMDDPRLTTYAIEDTVGWYEDHGFTDLEFVFTGHKWGKTGYPADVVIDDHPSLEWTQSGALNLLFDQPWNQDMLRHEARSVLRVYGWDTITRRIADYPHTSPIFDSPVVV